MLFYILLYLSLLDPGLGFIFPLTTNTGEVDLHSVVTHIALLEQKVNTLEPEVTTLKSKVSELETKLATYQKQQTIAASGLRSLQTAMASVKNKTMELSKNSSTNQTGTGTDRGGATFIRWGRTSCPVGNTVAYKGFAAGPDYASKGGAGNMLCLPNQPIYENHTSAARANYVSQVYGTEYETIGSSAFRNMQNDDMPCVVCLSQSKRSSMMVAGRNQCFPGLTLEYWGYLMGPHRDHAASQYICVDTDAEAEPGSQDNKDGNILYLVDSVCGSLNCPPYKDNWKLTCAVCSQ